MFVKICGITRLQDADLAARLGASALGFIFWPGSPRYVQPAMARSIAADLPASVAKVGVFVDQPADAIARIVDEAGLDAAQLHGRETPDFCRSLQLSLKEGKKGSGGISVNGGREIPPDPFVGGPMSGGRVIKAIGLTAAPAPIADFDPDVVLLLDAHDPARRGGTGRTVDWDAAREIARTRPTILAGGLNAANVKLAIRSVGPYGIDISSGVESSPGIKDSNRLRSFFEALHD